MPPAAAVVEIACDESGFTGTNLLDPASPVIAHAATDLTVPEAEGLLGTLRSRFNHRRAVEHKAHLLLRPGQPDAVAWFLAELAGRSTVHVVDKRDHLARRVLDLLGGAPSYLDGTRFGADRGASVAELRERADVLAAFVAMTHLKHRRRPDPAAVDRFLAVVPRGVRELAALGRSDVVSVLERLLDGDPAVPPPLEPLVPALAETVLRWSDGRRSVAVVHDEQSALTPQRTALLAASLAAAAFPGPPPLLGVRQVDSRHDPRVQVADLLAGLARSGATAPA
ncbi:hypothetical protein M1843_10820 [Isoptericola sp. 4D.3]|uniref:DUF3800 domain-containing protein n=1 Tax=Isoptericola peretonis TaxID=2918523 RepID=A0ABT0J428_9MICO|nr:hypothetical protein [Isoptericola sp. 4D.3]